MWLSRERALAPACEVFDFDFFHDVTKDSFFFYAAVPIVRQNGSLFCVQWECRDGMGWARKGGLLTLHCLLAC